MSYNFVTATSGGYARVTYELSQDIGRNESTITITKVEMLISTANDNFRCWVSGNVTIDSKSAATFSTSNNYSINCTVYKNNSYNNIIGNGINFTTVNLTHNADGTKTASFYVYLYAWHQTYGDQLVMSNAINITLPTIPRVSSLNASGVTLGQTMTINISRASSSFTDSVTYVCGNSSGTISGGTTSSSISWVPSIDLALQNTQGTSVTITLFCTTYSGGTSIGTSSISVSCTIPSTIVPSVSMTISDISGHLAKYGKFISGKSTVGTTSTYSGSYGSTISSIKVTLGSETKSGIVSSGGTSISIIANGSGIRTVTATVTDSRGRTASTSTTITVASYSRPTATLNAVYRCDADGNSRSDGDYATVLFSGYVTNLNPVSGYSNNTPKYYVRIMPKGSSDWQWNETTVTSGNIFAPNMSFFKFLASIDTEYTISVVASDDFDSSGSVNMVVPVAFALMDFNRDNKSIGFGQRADEANTMCIGLDVNLHSHRIYGLVSPTEDSGAATKYYVDQKITALAKRLGINDM